MVNVYAVLQIDLSYGQCVRSSLLEKGNMFGVPELWVMCVVFGVDSELKVVCVQTLELI